MLLHARLAFTLVRTKLTHALASTARAARRAVTDGITHGIRAVAVAIAALSALVCVAGCPSPPPANGTVSVAWEIRIANGVAVPCGRVGAEFVALRLRNRATGAFVATAFPCPNSPGTAPVPPGLYDVSFQLNGADGLRIAIAPDLIGVPINSGQRAELAPAVFQLTAASKTTVVLKVATGASSNCQGESAGGAGITGNTIFLARSDGGCEPVTFTRQRGTEQRPPYTVNCSSPQIAPCIEKDETLTTQLEADSYVIRVRGKLGILECWARDDTLDIPASTSITRTLGLMKVVGNGCPP
jgi:hypothetical protein